MAALEPARRPRPGDRHKRDPSRARREGRWSCSRSRSKRTDTVSAVTNPFLAAEPIAAVHLEAHAVYLLTRRLLLQSSAQEPRTLARSPKTAEQLGADARRTAYTSLGEVGDARSEAGASTATPLRFRGLGSIDCGAGVVSVGATVATNEMEIKDGAARTVRDINHACFWHITGCNVGRADYTVALPVGIPCGVTALLFIV